MITPLFAALLGALSLQEFFSSWSLDRPTGSLQEWDKMPGRRGGLPVLLRQVHRRHGAIGEAWVDGLMREVHKGVWYPEEVEISEAEHAVALWAVGRAMVGEVPLRAFMTQSYGHDHIGVRLAAIFKRLVAWYEVTKGPLEGTWLEVREREKVWLGTRLPRFKPKGQSVFFEEGELVQVYEHYTSDREPRGVGEGESEGGVEGGPWTLRRVSQGSIERAQLLWGLKRGACLPADYDSQFYGLFDGLGRPWAVWVQTSRYDKELRGYFLDDDGDFCENAVAESAEMSSEWIDFLIEVSARIDSNVLHWIKNFAILLAAHPNLVHHLITEVIQEAAQKEKSLKAGEGDEGDEGVEAESKGGAVAKAFSRKFEIRNLFQAVFSSTECMGWIEYAEAMNGTGLFWDMAKAMEVDPDRFSVWPREAVEAFSPPEEIDEATPVWCVAKDQDDRPMWGIYRSEHWVSPAGEDGSRAACLHILSQVFVGMDDSEPMDTKWEAWVRVGVRLDADVEGVLGGQVSEACPSVIEADYGPSVVDVLERDQSTFWWLPEKISKRYQEMSGVGVRVRQERQKYRQSKLCTIASEHVLGQVFEKVREFYEQGGVVEKAWDLLSDAQESVEDAGFLEPVVDRIYDLSQALNPMKRPTESVMAEKDRWIRVFDEEMEEQHTPNESALVAIEDAWNS